MDLQVLIPDGHRTEMQITALHQAAIRPFSAMEPYMRLSGRGFLESLIAALDWAGVRTLRTMHFQVLLPCGLYFESLGAALDSAQPGAFVTVGDQVHIPGPGIFEALATAFDQTHPGALIITGMPVTFSPLSGCRPASPTRRQAQPCTPFPVRFQMRLADASRLEVHTATFEKTGPGDFHLMQRQVPCRR